MSVKSSVNMKEAIDSNRRFLADAALVADDQGAAPYQVGQCYLVRTVTNYTVGRLVYASKTELVFEDAAWVADTGRFSDALATGVLNEVEPMPGPVVVNRQAVVDAPLWLHGVPLDRK